jgi:hypothetical protein
LKRITYVIILSFFLVAPTQGFSSNGETGSTAAKEKSLWQDIKTSAKPIKPNITEKDKDIVSAFNQYWGAVKARDFKQTYDMEINEHREKTSFDLYEYKRRKAVNIIAVRPLEVTHINEKEVIVKASLGFKAGMIDTVRFIRDRWIKDSTGWKHVPEEM